MWRFYQIVIVFSTMMMMVSSKEIFLGENYFFPEDNSVTPSFPPYMRKVQLYNHCSQRQIEITGGNSVTAKGLPDSPDAVMILKTVHYGNKYAVNIFGERSGKYLCFNKKGRLITRFSGKSPRCIFEEAFSTEPKSLYATFRSVFNNTWYIGFNSKGKSLLGSRFQKNRGKNHRCFYFSKRGKVFEDPLHLKLSAHNGPKVNPNKLLHYLKQLNGKR